VRVAVAISLALVIFRDPMHRGRSTPAPTNRAGRWESAKAGWNSSTAPPCWPE